MEIPKLDQPLLLDLPTNIIEEILLHLVLSDRKNIRMTCKRLYELCNSDRFCRNEKIKWSKDFISHVNVRSDLSNIGRRYYNLVLSGVELVKSSILPFFEVNGGKVRSLVIEYCDFSLGVLEPILVLCEGLCSLTLYFYPPRNEMGSFTLEPIAMTRPKVTYLDLRLPIYEPFNYFHQLFSIFPSIEHLKIELQPSARSNWAEFDSLTSGECSAIFDDVMKLGSNLKSLTLNVPLSQLIAKGSQFFEALPNLKDLFIKLNYAAGHIDGEKLYSCFSNIVSLKLCGIKGLRPAEMMVLLKNTGLNCLDIVNSLEPIVFDLESFKALLSSQLKIIHTKMPEVEGLPTTISDFSLEANKTVTDLYLEEVKFCSKSSKMMFLSYFRGLVHLTLTFPTNSVLQYVFQFQENLRSLVLSNCIFCTKEGFCGTQGDDRFKYSLNRLRKLEHLTIIRISSQIILSDDFKTAINSPGLKYLYINYEGCVVDSGTGEIRNQFAKISPVLYENLTNLRALRIQDVATPSREVLSSLLTNLKHLNYLRFDIAISGACSVAFIDYKHFSMTRADYDHLYTLGMAFYDKELDRMVVLNDGFGEELYSPKVSSYEIDWIIS